MISVRYILVCTRVQTRCSWTFKEGRIQTRCYSIKSKKTFEEIGIAKNIIENLGKNFPRISNPTLAQSAIIPAILQGKNVLIRDLTGSGKTFGILLSLLSQIQSQKRKSPGNHLILVPNIDLALQIRKWTQILTNDLNISQLASTSTSTTSPIVISTPSMMESTNINYQSIRHVYVDELDRVSPPLSKYATQKEKVKYFKHPPLGMKLLEKVFTLSIRPQFIASSATLNTVVRNMVKVKGWADQPIFFDTQPTKTPIVITHHVLIIDSDDSIRNMHIDEKEKDIPEFSPPVAKNENENDQENKFIHLDAVANAYHLLGSNRAILFIHSTGSVSQTVYELQKYNIPAIPLHEWAMNEDIAKPMMLVTTEFAARGIDISMQDVFIALQQISDPNSTGLPSDNSSYVHMAGRVGRQGHAGRVITFLRNSNVKTVKVDKKMKDLLDDIDANFEKLDIVDD